MKHWKNEDFKKALKILSDAKNLLESIKKYTKNKYDFNITFNQKNKNYMELLNRISEELSEQNATGDYILDDTLKHWIKTKINPLNHNLVMKDINNKLLDFASYDLTDLLIDEIQSGRLEDIKEEIQEEIYKKN